MALQVIAQLIGSNATHMHMVMQVSTSSLIDYVIIYIYICSYLLYYLTRNCTVMFNLSNHISTSSNNERHINVYKRTHKTNAQQINEERKHRANTRKCGRPGPLVIPLLCCAITTWLPNYRPITFKLTPSAISRLNNNIVQMLRLLCR